LLEKPPPKRGNGVVVWMFVCRDEAERHQVVCCPLQRAARKHPGCVALGEVWLSPIRAAAEVAIDVFAEKYGAKYPKAVECLTKDRQPLPAFYDFPAEHGIICAPLTRTKACS
jgi:hypothetical protein